MCFKNKLEKLKSLRSKSKKAKVKQDIIFMPENNGIAGSRISGSVTNIDKCEISSFDEDDGTISEDDGTASKDDGSEALPVVNRVYDGRDKFLCSRCCDIVLPEPGSRWRLNFGKADMVVKNSQAGCRLCALVVNQLRVARRNVMAWKFHAAAIELSTRQGESDKLHCRMTQCADGSRIRATALSVTYSAAPAPDQPVDLGGAKSKLDDCLVNHSCNVLCRGAGDLPSRLLDLENQGLDDSIKLIETSKEIINDYRYAALSYCWGYSTPFTTEPSNLKSRLQGFSILEMPLTLRETVRVVKALGIRYLWIDALCILQQPPKTSQDDLEPGLALVDWKRESARMDSVYGNSFLTIVAAGASDSQEGLINPKFSCHLPYRSKGSSLTPREQSATVTLNPPRPHLKTKSRFEMTDTSRVDIHDEPISGRAWAFQEWLLSPRLLAFTTTGVHFICDKYEMRARHASYKYRLPKSPSIPSLQDWQMILMNFAPRNMTNPRDKLPALSGLAKKFFALTNGACGNYLAGLWKATLLSDLTWKQYSNFLLPTPNKEGRCPGRAPSWSWAAIDGAITFNRGGTDSKDVEVKDCYTKPVVGYDCFGEVESGVLVIRCAYKRASIITDEQTPRLRDENGIIFAAFFGDDPFETNQLTDKPPSDESKIYCLKLRSDGGDWCGIVVRIDKDKDFTRVGYFLTIGKSDFKTSKMGEFKIV